MKPGQLIIALATIVGIFGSCMRPDESITMESLLEEMVDRDAVARFPHPDYRLKQHSSYNRVSTSPEDTLGWFNNFDRNTNDSHHNFVRIEENQGRKEWVLMEHEGAGAIVRNWMPFSGPAKADSDTRIRIYLDGSTEPVLEGILLGLFNGEGLFPYSFAHKSLRSAVSFFPIPYAKGCKITADDHPFFFQFTYREYPKGTRVKIFTMEDFDAAESLIEEVGKSLFTAENSTEGKKASLTTSLSAKVEKSVELPGGAAALRTLTLKLGSYEDSSITRSIILKLEFDGMKTVWCPVGDFFGTGIGLNPFQGWYRTVSEDGTMSYRWIMPYRKSGKISIVNLGEKPVEVKLEAEIGKWKWDERSMYFNAAWRGQYPVPTRPYSDWNYVSLKGHGVYVGDALTVMNPVERWWGEGDEKIWVDGESFPSIFGTGTEDYYGYSWGGLSTDFYEHPFHAQPRCHVNNKLNRKKDTNKRNTSGYSTETRTPSLDAMPFSSALQLDMEVWSWTDCDMGYAVGVYWYGDATTTSNRKPDPAGTLQMYQLPY